MSPTWTPTDKDGASPYALRSLVVKALEGALGAKAPAHVVRSLQTALLLLAGALPRGDESFRPDIVEIVEDALDRYRHWRGESLLQ